MLTDLYPPFIGGIEQHVRNLSHGLVQRGHSVSVATMAHGDLAREDNEGDVRIHRLRSTAQRASRSIHLTGRPYAAPFPDPEVVRDLRRVVSREQPDIVHGHNWLIRSFLPMHSRSGPPLVMTLHDFGIVCAKRSFMFGERACSGPGFRKCLRCAADNYGTARGMVITLGNWAMQPSQRSAVDRFLPVSNAVAMGNELAQHSLPFEVLPNFVPDDVAIRADFGHSALAGLPRKPYWLYVGALSRHKGVHVLLEAYEALAVAPPLVLVGPPWEDTPQRFPANTVVLKSLPHPAVMAVWRGASLGLIPSLFPDPCPTVAMEAMACGVPVVASRIGGLPDLVDDGETGLLVQAGEVDAFIGALSAILADPARAQEMGEAGKRKVVSFTASAVIDRLEGVYTTLLADRSSHGTVDTPASRR